MDFGPGDFGGKGLCPHCMHRLTYILPVEPLYDLVLAAAIIPMSHDALRRYLSKHRDDFPRRYRQDQQKRLHRQLTASEIRQIRVSRMRYKTTDGKSYRLPDRYAE